MKKILALTLAAIMAAGMTTVAFAVDPNNSNYDNAWFEDQDYDFVQVPLIAQSDDEVYVSKKVRPLLEERLQEFKNRKKGRHAK